MEIRLLNSDYKKNQEFYKDFLENNLLSYGDKYISTDSLNVNIDIPNFPIYLARASEDEKLELFLELIEAIETNFKDLNRSYILDELFWHSYLCIYMRDYIIKTYPQIFDSYQNFKNIVIKDFDWENYIYKAVLAFQYVSENVDKSSQTKYYKLILDNLDVFNYIIKAEIFRNSNFLINFLDIIEDTGTSSLLKSKIKNRPDLGNDERYGRRVVYEFNKSYPIVLSPMLSKEELQEYFLEFLGYYTQELSISE